MFFCFCFCFININQDIQVVFLGSEFSGHPCSVARDQRNLRMLCFVLGKFWKKSKMSIVYGGKGVSSGPRIICL